METEYHKQKAEEEAKKKRAEIKRLQELEQEKAFTSAYTQRKKQEVELAISKIPDEKREKLKKVFLMEFTAKEMFRKIYDSKGFDHPLVQAQRLKWISEKELDMSKIHQDYFREYIWQSDTISS